MRKTLLLAAVLVAAAPLLGGCVTPYGRALVPELLPLEVGVQHKSSCADQADAVGQADPEHPLTASQQRALYRACEAERAAQRIKIDPEAGRRAIGIPGVPGV